MNTIIRSEDSRYEDIRKATIADMGQEPFDKYHKDTGKRWLDIARVWNKVYGHGKHFVLTSAVHHIMWGVYPYEPYIQTFKHLLGLVEEELLRDGEAFRAWNKWRAFNNLLDHTLYSFFSFGRSGLSTHFIEHGVYLNIRARYQIVYNKTKPLNPEEKEEDYKDYEETVKFLIPAANTWTREQWGNDLVVSEELKKTYGIDYAASHENRQNYNNTICLIRLQRKQGMSTDTLRYAVAITEMPWAIVKLIWPENTEKEIATILIKSYELIEYNEGPFAPIEFSWPTCPPDCFGFERFRDSFVFKHVKRFFYQGVYDNDSDICPKLRRIIFDLELTA